MKGTLTVFVAPEKMNRTGIKANDLLVNGKQGFLHL